MLQQSRSEVLDQQGSRSKREFYTTPRRRRGWTEERLLDNEPSSRLALETDRLDRDFRDPETDHYDD